MTLTAFEAFHKRRIKSMKKREPLSWKPLRRGNTYCAPACGHGCTWAKYEQAVKDASKLAERMGDGWEPRIWENGGWHYSVRRPHLEIHTNSYVAPEGHKTMSYTAYLNRDPDSGGGHWVASAASPEAAAKKVIEEVREEHAVLSAFLESVS